MKKFLFGFSLTVLMVACNNSETKTDETAAKPADTVAATKPAIADSIPSTVVNVVIPETPEAMATELCRLNKGIKLAKAMGDNDMANTTQKMYKKYNEKLKAKFGNDYEAKKVIREVMEKCDKN